jgi:hypothetical protein
VPKLRRVIFGIIGLFVTFKNVHIGEKAESPKIKWGRGGCVERMAYFCRVVGSPEACYIGCSSLPLLRTVALVGPSWGGAGASLCATSLIGIERGSRVVNRTRGLWWLIIGQLARCG